MKPSEIKHVVPGDVLASNHFARTPERIVVQRTVIHTPRRASVIDTDGREHRADALTHVTPEMEERWTIAQQTAARREALRIEKLHVETVLGVCPTETLTRSYTVILQRDDVLRLLERLGTPAPAAP